MIRIRAAADAQMPVARELFLEYAGSLDFSLCFQGFEEELATLPGKYAPPAGRLLLAWAEGDPAGCVALRPFGGEGICEMKRLYVRPAHRGRGLGRALAEAIIRQARETGYTRMRLDTSEGMAAARRLYESLGFYRIGRYNNDHLEDTVFMELALAAAPAGRAGT